MSQRSIAIFDFDGTLVQGDSLLPFLEFLVGRTRARLALLHAVRTAVTRFAAEPHRRGDVRTAVKAGLLQRTVAGVPAARLDEAAERLAGWVRWHPPMLEALKAHAGKGHRVVVATGALTAYMPRLLRGLPVDDLLATGLETLDGVLTGGMDRHGNCVREEKARRVTAYMAAHGPFVESWGYGNRPSDLPFLALMRHPTVVKTVKRGGQPAVEAAASG